MTVAMPEKRDSLTRWAIRWCACAALLASGCSKLHTEYGPSQGRVGRNSLNGFGALRTSYEEAGFRSRDVNRLSNRVSRCDVIVWTPRDAGEFYLDSTVWLDRWLKSGGRTLVYILPDSGSEVDYWRDAAKLAPPQQRLEYRRRAARSVNRRLIGQLRPRTSATNGWFLYYDFGKRVPLGDISGPWEEKVCDQTTQELDSEIEFDLRGFDEENYKIVAEDEKERGGVFLSTYQDVKKLNKTPHSFQPLLKAESGSPIIAEVGSKKWPGSKVIVVAGGSLLTNYAFTRPFNRRIANQLVAASTPSGDVDLRVGFLLSYGNRVSVSESKPGVPRATGMELLTVWPMSIVTTHGVVLGLVICLMLVPIFGRPRRVNRSQQSSFGDHLDAVAALMNRAGGEAYARHRISEYMKRMHGETSGRWVLPESEHAHAAAPIPPPTPKHFGSAARSASPPSLSGGTGPVDRPAPQADPTASDSLIDQALAGDEFPDQPDSSASPPASGLSPAEDDAILRDQSRDASQDDHEENR